MSNDLPNFLEPCRQQLPGQPSTSPSFYLNAVFRHTRLPSLSHALWWPSDIACETCLIFLPGNPGLLDFYTPFLTAIHEKSGRAICILAHSFVGHTPGIDDSNTDTSKTCLSAQIDAATEVVDAVKSSYTKIVVAGHSVGSWVTLQVLKARSVEVKSVLLLFPTIRHIVNTPNGRQICWIFHEPFPRILSWLSIATRLFPMRLLKLLYPHWPDAQLKVLRMLLDSPSCIRAYLRMGRDEMRSIKELDVELLREQKHKVHMYFAEMDDWVGDNKVAILQEFNPGDENLKIVHGREEIPHAFCINHGKELADQCYVWLEQGGFL